jgi:transposase
VCSRRWGRRRRHELTDAEWARLAPLLPPRQAGKRRQDDRLVIDGSLWKLATGAPWRDLPERYGPWQSASTRFRRWRRAGGWDRMLAAVQQQAAAAGELDWAAHFVDGTVIRAHQHAAGAPGGDPEAEARGRSQGGCSTKVHLRAEGGGQPLTLVLTPGQRHEATAFEQLLEQGAVRRPGRGRPRLRPGRVVGDRGYTGRPRRAYCHRRGLRHTIPRLRTERRGGRFDRAVYRPRNRVERLINRCKQFRSLATRYEKRAASYRALWLIAMIMLWIAHAH